MSEHVSGLFLSAGDAVGGCIIESVLGSGGMGVVFRARQHLLKREVALKVITPAFSSIPQVRERFLKEARAAAAIDHPNILPIYEVGQEGGLLYIAMRFVPEGDLATRIHDGEPLSSQAVVSYVSQAAAALDAAHAAGIIHRDVKPQNILVSGDAGPTDHIYLTDFGLARFLQDVQQLTSPGAILGTPAYMSPDQAVGRPVDARTDVYALGCVLFELLASHVPYVRANPAAALAAHCNDPIPSVRTERPDLPAEIDAVIDRALAKSPGDRYPSAGGLGCAAAAALKDASTPTEPSFPDPTPLYIQTQAPRMTPERFGELLQYLDTRGWSKHDVRKYAFPWAPAGWKRTPP